MNSIDMNKHLTTLLFLTFFCLSSTAQNWKFMVETTLQITQRENKTFQLNDTTQVEIRDFGIDEFTIFKISSAKKTYLNFNFTQTQSYSDDFSKPYYS